MKPRLYYDVQELLRRRGYTAAADNDNYIWSVLDYLDLQDNDYTIFQWLDDTIMNYPEDLAENIERY